MERAVPVRLGLALVRFRLALVGLVLVEAESPAVSWMAMLLVRL